MKEWVGDTFVTPCLKVQSGLLSILSHPDPIDLCTVQQGVTNNIEYKKIIDILVQIIEYIGITPSFGLS